MDFQVHIVGISGETDILLEDKKNDAQSTGNDYLPSVALPVGLPPIWKNIEDELLGHLESVDQLPIHDYKRHQKYVPRDSCPKALLKVSTMPPDTDLAVERDSKTGALIGYTEVKLSAPGSSALNSLSLNREPSDAGASIKGSTSNFPFWPGGLDPPEISHNVNDDTASLTTENKTVAPGLSRGLTLGVAPTEQSQPLKVTDLFSVNDLFAFDSEEEDDEEDKVEQDAHDDIPDDEGNDVDELVKEAVVISITDATPVKQDISTEYAVRLNVNEPISDFYEKVPDMAYKWPFELDVFQKQAVLCLENHDNVFVAAHTSAGKTVVAEYAIALSKRHMTRTIYTSPIKALSNQKFRDFKQTFGDVGLITGDIQINPEATCLIMTTEILRSMLYGGSDIIRDVEWVIFDEVHYINDAERGVVWEEVLIMLPAHVHIILLSATVPNHMEFADWVGKTKKKNVYVISTLKRPVPLEHYLYTGNSNKTSDELFLLVDADSHMQETGYKKAVKAKKERTSAHAQKTGPKGPRGGHPNNEKNVWISVIDMLKKKDKLPAVAFTFSKKKIEENSSFLTSVDLTSGAEKSKIHMFIQRSIDRLKGTDKELPQVVYMQDLLKRGIGIHHSGVLPIMKEIVEMLFQQGLLKVLFATETFAMGVNMPARTVIFDSIRKHDGTNFRDLKPAEYIQMAGRAGRRGLDTTGTVIILCKGDIPELSDLHKMMLGKMTTLESKFRLTYTMMLNLLRVEKLRIQDMLKRSFSEFASQKDEGKHREALHSLRRRVQNLKSIECYFCSQDMEEYYSCCKEYQTLKTYLHNSTVTHPQCVKYLASGRVILLRSGTKIYLAVTLTTNNRSPRIYKCLVLSEESLTSMKESLKVDDSALVRAVKDDVISMPSQGEHLVVDVEPQRIHLITQTSVDISSPEKIIDDFAKRQIPRFRDNPPGKSVLTLIQELSSLDTSALGELDPVHQFSIRDLSMVEQFDTLHLVKSRLESFICNECSTFKEHFDQVGVNMSIKSDFEMLKFKLSEDSLQLLPEYQQRIRILQELRYIDRSNTVQLKGKVACELSQQELIVTELIFENVLSELHYTEIAALLSCVVFEMKRCSKPNIPPNLEKGVGTIEGIARKLGQVQKTHIPDFVVEDYVSEFKFGLVEVVFEWARGMPFCEITKLTDVQEGIIVRCIQRLDELLRDVKDCARIIGDPVLGKKMEEASNSIKRDIVFAASLYTQ